MEKKYIKTFSEMFENKKEEQKPLGIIPEDIGGMPNLPENNGINGKSGKIEKMASTRYLRPKAQSEKGVDYKIPEDQEPEKIKVDEKKVQFFGKIAKMPKKTKASEGYNFLENIKANKDSIWYFMVEKTDNELQMIKFNQNRGVDLNRFTTDLKNYYIDKYSKNTKLIEAISKIECVGENKWTRITNIPNIKIGDKKLIAIITEDLVKLLSV
jgi:hypothetical protein